MKTIFINLVPIKTGGGLQNAINLILGISEQKNNINKYTFIIRSSNLEDVCIQNKIKYLKISDTLCARLCFELFFFIRKKRSIIFTLFGGKPVLTYRNFSISGCAYSNLFYPEINFWGHLPKHKIILKKLKDYYRFKMVKSSDVIIFETEILRKRAIQLKKFDPNKTFVVKMAVNKVLNDFYENNKTANEYNLNDNKKYIILYLGTSHPNKRQHLLIDISKELKKYLVDFCFITTMHDCRYTHKFIKSINRENLEDFIINLGAVESKKVGKVISESDAMINIAQLESFSNNFVEAWTFSKPLILTDADWSRSSCGASAFYINPENPKDAAQAILKLITNNYLQSEIIKTYEKTLSQYSNYKEKTQEYIEIIQKYSRGGNY